MTLVPRVLCCAVLCAGLWMHACMQVAEGVPTAAAAVKMAAQYNVQVPIAQAVAGTCAVLCCAVLCCAVLCCAVLCCAVQRIEGRFHLPALLPAVWWLASYNRCVGRQSAVDGPSGDAACHAAAPRRLLKMNPPSTVVPLCFISFLRFFLFRCVASPLFNEVYMLRHTSHAYGIRIRRSFAMCMITHAYTSLRKQGAEIERGCVSQPA